MAGRLVGRPPALPKDEHEFAVSTAAFLPSASDPGRVGALLVQEVRWEQGRPEPVAGTEREIRADLVLLAMGFTAVADSPLFEQLGVTLTERGAVARDDTWRAEADGVFVAGDAGRGQSLIVWAIAEGRACAAAVDAYLMGETRLPAPVVPTSRPLSA
ncbi:MAG: FAD-dependent oxidoreductase [Actinomycetales bacterium]|nr:FAD-dependent oxidoreductase [Actinomycetales bacterium]